MVSPCNLISSACVCNGPDALRIAAEMKMNIASQGTVDHMAFSALPPALAGSHRVHVFHPVPVGIGQIGVMEFMAAQRSSPAPQNRIRIQFHFTVPQGFQTRMHARAIREAIAHGEALTVKNFQFPA